MASLPSSSVSGSSTYYSSFDSDGTIATAPRRRPKTLPRSTVPKSRSLTKDEALLSVYQQQLIKAYQYDNFTPDDKWDPTVSQNLHGNTELPPAPAKTATGTRVGPATSTDFTINKPQVTSGYQSGRESDDDSSGNTTVDSDNSSTWHLGITDRESDAESSSNTIVDTNDPGTNNFPDQPAVPNEGVDFTTQTANELRIALAKYEESKK